MNIPNSITLARILTVPLVVWLILIDEMLYAFILFLISGASDALDGLIAKKFNLVTRLGKYLDPLADKILLVSIYITLGVKGDLPVWLVILVVSRDLLIIGGIVFSYLIGTRIRIHPLPISKFNTFCQIILAAIVLATEAVEVELGLWHWMAVYIVAITTILSGYSYLSSWIKLSGDQGTPGGNE